MPGRDPRRRQPTSPADREAAGCPLPPGRRRSIGHNESSLLPPLSLPDNKCQPVTTASGIGSGPSAKRRIASERRADERRFNGASLTLIRYGHAMLRVLTLATLFPSGARPTFGGFVERQTRALAAREGVEIEVVAPVGLPIWPLSRHPHYAPLRDLPRQETRNGLVVHRPHFRVWPGVGQAGTARRMADALLPLLRDIRARFPFEVIDAEFFWP